jgi:hypothetical protein
MRYSSVKEYEKQVSGGEPTWNGQGLSYSLISALNWYNYHSDYNESKKFTLQYLKDVKESKDVIALIDKVPENKFQNLGFVCRMKMRGAPLTEKNLQWIDKFISSLKKEKTKVEEKKVVDTPVVSIQERTQEKSKEYIAEIENLLDTYITSKTTPKDTFVFLQKLGVKNAHSTSIKKYLSKKLDEFESVLNTNDKILKEGYSNFSKKELKDMVNLIQNLIRDLDRISQVNKLNRKPRKVKAKPVEKVISKLQFKKDDDDLKITSSNPSDILGCSQLWVFNTKTRKLGVYISKDSGGLSLKGTTLLNFNEETSVQKTIRKPENLLHDFIKSTKITMKKTFASVSAVEQALTGRINSDTLLLKIIK